MIAPLYHWETVSYRLDANGEWVERWRIFQVSFDPPTRETQP